MNTPLMIVWLGMVTLVSLGLHSYVALHYLSAVPTAWRLPFWTLVGVLTLAVPGVFLLMPLSGHLLADLGQRAGYLWLGLLSVWVVLLGVTDLGLWVARLLPGDEVDQQRRAFLGLIGSSVAGVAALGISTAGAVRAWMAPEIVRQGIPLPHLPESLDGFRIAQISDIHVGPTVRADRVRAIVDAVNGLGADLVALTGDLVDGPVSTLAEHVAPIGDLTSRHGTWFVTGNHEYYSGAVAWCDHLAGLGLRVLNNAHEVIEHEGGRIVVAGVTDEHAERIVPDHACDPHAALDGAPEADLRLLLAHQPNTALRARGLGIHLVLAGHTHAGQYFPFTWLIYLVQRFVAGLHHLDEMQIYVNRGTTWWGPPLRLGAPPEITLLTLRRRA